MSNKLDAKKVKKYWKDQIPPNLDNLRACNQKFEDKYFPPKLCSLVSKDEYGNYIDKKNGPENERDMEEEVPTSTRGGVIWKRVTEIRPKWEMFENKIEFDDVIQGSIGDCYFLSAITALAEFPYLIAEKFRTNKFDPIGYYEVILFIDGEWQIVFVDDYFPVRKNGGGFAYAKPHGNELWAILLEKVWAKVNGGYSNIIGGMVNEPVTALTGFPVDFLIHSELDNEELFDKVKKGDDEGAIMSSATKYEESIVSRKGLVAGHAYTLIMAKEWKGYERGQERRIKLLQLRNPWGEKEWSGDWADNSSRWTPELKKFFGYSNADDGKFFIDISNYVQYFDATFICYVLYGAVIKSYFFENDIYFRHPVVFNIKINKPSKTGISVLFKGWRYNRDIHDVVHPCSLLLFKYDNNRNIKEAYGKWSSLDDVNLIETLESGYYVLWVYVGKVRGDNNFKFSVSLSSVENFQAEYIGIDSDFMLIQKLLLENYKRTGINNINASRDYFLGSDKTLSKFGISSILIYNKSTTTTLNVEASSKRVINVDLLPPYTGMRNISISIPPGMSSAILGSRNSNNATEFAFSFSISMPRANNYNNNNTNNNANTNLIFRNFLHFELNENAASGVRTGSYQFIDRSKAYATPSFNDSSINGKEILRIATTRAIEITEYTLRNEYPYEMKLLLEKFPKKSALCILKWEKIETNKEGIYFGEINAQTGSLQGRGVFLWKIGEKMKYIGYWYNNKMNGKGMLLTNKNEIKYEGDFVNGKKEGKGTFYIFTGDDTENKRCYIGPFVNDKMEGKGKYKFANGDVWEGMFKNDKKEGIGEMTYANGKKGLVKYVEDNLVGTVKLEKDEGLQLDKHKQRDSQISISTADDDDIKKPIEDKPTAFNFAEMLYRQRTKIQSEVIVQKLEKEITETPEEKRHRLYLENIAELRTKEPFMVEQIFELRPLLVDNTPGNIVEENFVLKQESPNKKYLGGEVNNIRHGRGAYYDGNYYYIGYFINGYPSGYFRKFTNDKKINFIGNLDMNFKIMNFGTLYLHNGDTYRGSFYNEKMNGFGTYFFAKGESWTGHFCNGQFEGVGKYYYENGLLTETITYHLNQVVPNQTPYRNIEREDFTIQGAEYFFNSMMSIYPGVIERLLRLFPMKCPEETLKWVCQQLQNGSCYVGQTKLNNTFHGRGCFIYGNGLIKYYVGYLENGYAKGYGAYYDYNWNCLYEGQFENNQKHGFGKWYERGYIGYFLNDQPHGDGVQYYTNGARFEGKFINGLKHDKGYMINETYTTIQEMHFNNDNCIEQGEIEYVQKEKHQAKIKNELGCLLLIHGKYTKMFLDLERKDDYAVLKRGTKDFVDGTYIGEMNSIGFKHGRGVLLMPHSNMFYVGYFKDNMKEGYGKIYYEEGKEKYIGEFKNDKPYGRGKYMYPNGESLEGEFNEVGEGQGCYTFADGSTWRGSFYSWRLNGCGSYYTNQNVYMGNQTYKFGQLIS